tara:strand:- start:5374 stop:6459 length:1086 start_codon:yes stop_codon:yes gene_type:complete
MVGLGIAGLFTLSSTIGSETGLFLIAPFGATSVLLFAVPNSPLAQPWSAVVGNTVAALVSLAVCMVVHDPVLRTATSVGLAVCVTILCRAVHPPAGAVAMTVALSPDAVRELGFKFAITPVAFGTIILVVVAAIYARLTGRRYPFRQFDEPNKHGTSDTEPMERLGLTEQELTNILERYRQTFNLGVEDLARLIGAAEVQAASHRTQAMVAADIMSRNLITVLPTAPISEVSALFRRHAFTSLPVVSRDGFYQGIIFPIHLIARELERASSLKRGFSLPLSRRLGKRHEPQLNAHQIMSPFGPRAVLQTPISALLLLLAEGDVEAVPVIETNRILGIVTKTDLLNAMARTSIAYAKQPAHI